MGIVSDAVDAYFEGVKEKTKQQTPEMFDFTTVPGFRTGLVRLFIQGAVFAQLMYFFSSFLPAQLQLTPVVPMGFLVAGLGGAIWYASIQRRDQYDPRIPTRQEIQRNILKDIVWVLGWAMLYFLLLAVLPTFALAIALGFFCGEVCVLLGYFLSAQLLQAVAD